MLGLINNCLESFIVETFGEPIWNSVLEETNVQWPWVSTCPYADAITYTLVTSAAAKLGVTVATALEAYGVYFVTYAAGQVGMRGLSPCKHASIKPMRTRMGCVYSQ